jgi:F0F1-type ATP synthase membrane subunit c/vacuolar-type H+-ATPase subunit K
MHLDPFIADGFLVLFDTLAFYGLLVGFVALM